MKKERWRRSEKTAGYVKGGVAVTALALVLAALGAVLTIIGPDKIGEITIIMSEGLITGIDLCGDSESGHNAYSYLRSERSFHLCSALYNGNGDAENVLPYARRTFAKDKPRAAEIFQHAFTGRCFEPHYKRRFDFAAGLDKRAADDNFFGDAVCGLSCDDVCDGMEIGSYLARNNACRAVRGCYDNVAFAEIFHGAPGKSRQTQRICRGDVFGSRSGSHFPCGKCDKKTGSKG